MHLYYKRMFTLNLLIQQVHQLEEKMIAIAKWTLILILCIITGESNEFLIIYYPNQI